MDSLVVSRLIRKHKDFRIGSHFYMSSRKYLCTNIGTRTICAVRADFTNITTSRNGKTTTRKRKLTKKEIGGPPYWLLESVIDEYDIKVCFKTRQGIKSAYGRPTLTKKESELLASVQRGEWKSVRNLAAAKKKAVLATRETLKKNKATRLKDLLAKMPRSYSPHEEDWGKPAGKEVW